MSFQKWLNENALETCEQCRANMPQTPAYLAMFDLLHQKGQLTPFQAMMNVLMVGCGDTPEHEPQWLT